MTKTKHTTSAGEVSPGWDDGMICRRKNMFWEQDYFPGQNAPIDLAVFNPNALLL